MKNFSSVLALSIIAMLSVSLSATIDIGSYSLNNTKSKANEDRMLVPCITTAKETLGDNSEFLIGVFDGHGGDEVSAYLQQNMENRFLNALQIHEGNICVAFASVFEALDKEILENQELRMKGATATLGYAKNSDLVLVNLGDSKAVVFDLTMDCNNIYKTNDHKPDPNTEEGVRIEQKGGELLEDFGWRVRYQHSPYNFSDLAMSRAFGDLLFKNIGVISVPDIYKPIKIQPGRTCAIFATDGLWDIFEPADVAQFVKELRILEKCSPERICQQLAQRARDNNSADDISIVIVFF